MTTVKAVIVAMLILVGCGDDKDDVRDRVTDCVAAAMHERLTGSTLPDADCPDD